MASLHFSVKSISRGDGRSATAAAAYRSRSRIYDERTGETHDYSRMKNQALFTGIYAPANAPEWVRDREKLWNAAELAETQFNRKKNAARVARDFVLALPHELTLEQNRRLLQDYVREQFVRKGYIVDASIHAPHEHGDDRNIHAHVLVSERVLKGDGFAPEKDRALKDKNLVYDLREKWADLMNRHLERYGHEARVDPRSFREQGIDKEPEIHLGKDVTAAERRTSASHQHRTTERGDRNREIQDRNRERSNIIELLHEIEKPKSQERSNGPGHGETSDRQQRREEWLAQRAAERAAQTAQRSAAYAAKRAGQISHHETVQHIGVAYAETQTGPELVRALERQGLQLGRASDDDAARAQVQRSYGLRAQRFAAGDYVAMNGRGQIYKLDATTIHDDEKKITARLAEIDAALERPLPTVSNLRGLHYEQREARLLQQQQPEPFMAALNTVDAGLSKAARIADKTLDLAAEVLDLGGSAARVVVQMADDILSGPSAAISGGTEEQKRHSNALAAARERAKAMRTPPADQPRQRKAPAAAATPAEPPPQVQESAALRAALQRVRDMKKAEDLSDDDEKKKLDRHRSRERDR